MTTHPNLFASVAEGSAGETVEELVRSQHVRIERIVSNGQASPDGFWYDQEEVEWVTVLTGEAFLRFEDGEVIQLAPGDSITIEAHRKHRVDSTADDEPTIWLAVFFEQNS